MRGPGLHGNVLGSMSSPRGAHPRTNRALLSIVAALPLALVTNCTFPEYDFNPGSEAGRSGGLAEGGAAGTTAGGPSGGAGAGSGTTDGGAPDPGSAGEAGAAGSELGCVFPTPVNYAKHCYDHTLSTGETGTDCGGADCAPCSTAAACTQDSDCVSHDCTAAKTCRQVLSVKYSSIDANRFTRAPKFKLDITYLDDDSPSLTRFAIRYYFSHNGVTEPVIGLDSQATFDPEPGGSLMDISNKVIARVTRLPTGLAATLNGRKTDSYLEISFTSQTTMLAGDLLSVTQDIVAASSEVPFDQETHYSYLNGGALDYTAVTVYRNGELVWGIEPPVAPLPDCGFVAGVNFAGPALTVDGLPIAASNDQSITFEGNIYDEGAMNTLPITDTPTTKLLSSAFTFSTQTVTWPVPSGKYFAYAWMTSADATDTGTLLIQDNQTDKFVGTQNAVGSGWSLIGPYPIEVQDGKLTMSATGTVHLAGMKLYRTASF